MSLSKNTSLTRRVTIDLYNNTSKRITDFISRLIPGFTTERALASIAVILIIKKIVQYIATQRRYHELLQRAKRKRKERDNQMIFEFTPIIEISEEISALVLNSTITELVQILNQGKTTSEEILRIFHNRAISIGAKLELIAESNFTEALELARKCDRIRSNTPKEERERLGSLFGVPICINDSFKQKGLDATCGLAKNCFNPCSDDSIFIKVLKAQGAIPFIRTNICQALASFDTANNIWGRAVNPWDIERTPGGSCGGDAALVAARCAPAGYGSDYYGSVRIPAAFTGTYGFKATSGRLSATSEDVVSSEDLAKFTFLRGAIGPIGKCTDDLVQLTKALIVPENENMNPLYPSLPWNEEKYCSQEKLKIGYITTADFFGASKPCRRAVIETVEALQRAGHQTIELQIPNFEAMVSSVIRVLFLGSQAQRFLTALDGEKPIDDVKRIIRLCKHSNVVKKLFKIFFGKRLESVIDNTMKITANRAALALGKFVQLRDHFLNYWVDLNLDAIITPACALPAFELEHDIKLMFSACYLWLANIANAPAGVVPVTKVLSGEDVYTQEDTVYNDDLLFKLSQESMNGTVGLPIGVQVMTLPWQDEKCLRVMRIIETEIKFHDLPTVN